MTSYWLGMVTGGPRVITLGWIIVGFFALLVGMAMGEICSTYPTAGGLYFWSAKLARKQPGEVVVVHGMVQPARPDRRHRQRRLRAGHLHRLLHPHVRRRTSSSRSGRSTSSSSPMLVAHGLLNTFGVHLVRILGEHQRVVARRRCGDHRHRVDGRRRWRRHDRHVRIVRQAGTGELAGWSGKGFVIVYMFGLGLLLAQYTITGLRCLGPRERGDRRCPHRGTEGDRAGDLRLGDRRLLPQPGDDPGAAQEPRCVFAAIAFGGDGRRLPRQRRPATHPASAVGDATAKFLVFISVVAQFFCGMASRDGDEPDDLRLQPRRGSPGSKFWHRINPKHAHTNELGLARRRPVGARRFAVDLPEERVLDCLLRPDRHLRDRSLHLLRDPDLPAPHEPRLRAGTVEPEGILEDRRLDGGDLGRVHHDSLLRSGLPSVLAAVR